jgi:hypothetical protein
MRQFGNVEVPQRAFIELLKPGKQKDRSRFLNQSLSLFYFFTEPNR